MFFPTDPTTEIIAYFIGHFELSSEAMRIRVTYEQIEAAKAAERLDPSLDQRTVQLTQNYALNDYQPGVDYRPPDWAIRGHSQIEALLANVPILHFSPDQHISQHTIQPLDVGDSGPVPMIGPQPGSVLSLITQTIALSDNDVVVLGTYDGPLVFHSGADTAIVAMQAAASAITTPITELSALHAPDDVATFVDQVGLVAHNLATVGDGTTQVNATDNIVGNYLNGEEVQTAPDLIESLPPHWHDVMGGTPEAEPESPASNTDHISMAGDDIDGSVTLNAGGNLLVNEAGYFNGGLTAAVFAVNGDLHQLDAIIQTNAYFDTDTIDGDVPGAAQNPANTTMAFNVASFVQEVGDVTGQAAAANPHVMPANWQVSVVSGDVMFIDRLSQFTFSSDQDMSVLSATSTNTLVTSGENIGLNHVSFADLGQYYDLIMVGGNIYDANVIVQTNVLYDNDLVEMLGEGSSGTGSVNSSGNLLWNQARIDNVGPTSFVHDIPQHYQQAMNDLDDGQMAMPSGFQTDGQFEGFPLLRALYVAGDIYDLHYIEQTNILGDADMVAIQKTNLLGDSPDTDWTVSTGSNALVNTAAIKDFDALGDHAYIGGDVYSDAILIQADIITAAADADADADASGGDALVTEAIAFLDIDHDVGSGDDAGIGPTPLPADGPPADIIQSVLA